MSKSLSTSKLNPAQQSAVNYGVTKSSAATCGPLLIIAGAGSGKTRTLAERAANLIARGIPPNRILMLTFTRNAAAEMSQRVQGIVTQQMTGNNWGRHFKMPWSGTFHGTGLKLLRLHREAAGLDKHISILDQNGAVAVMSRARATFGNDDSDTTLPDAASAQRIYSFAINAQQPLRSVLARRFPEWLHQHDQLDQLFKRYTRNKRQSSLLDFDDLLLLWLKLFTDRSAARSLKSMFDHVLVDEYQDTNALQAAILWKMAPNGKGLTVVGDDDQAIYSFRSADVRNILDFPDQFTPRAKIITLQDNYRSTAAILDASNAVIGLAKTRFDKTLQANNERGGKPALVTVADEVEQARYVVERVLTNLNGGIGLAQQAVLYRNDAHCAEVERELVRQNVSYSKSGGHKLTDAKGVKDVLAVLQWASRSRDVVAARHMLQLMPGIGPVKADAVIATVRNRRLLPALKAFKPPAKVAPNWRKFVQLMRSLRSKRASWPGQIAAVHAWCKRIGDADQNETEKRGERDVATLTVLAANSKSRRRFLEALALEPHDLSVDGDAEPAESLTLSTIHSAKGREFEAVFVLNAVEGCLPNSQSHGDEDKLDEERRLLYVAMTRAKNQLTIMLPEDVEGSSSFGSSPALADVVARSRFIPKEIVRHFDKLKEVPEATGFRLTFIGSD